MKSPFKQKITFQGTGVNVDFLGKGTQHVPNRGTNYNWFEHQLVGGEFGGFGRRIDSPSSHLGKPGTDQLKTKTTKTYRANIDWGKFSLFGEKSKSYESFLNKPYTGFEEDTDYSGTTQTTNFGGLGPSVTFSDERDIIGSSHTAYGEIRKTRIGGGAKIHLGGSEKPSFMGILEGSGGRQKTSQDYYTISASGNPLRPGLNLGSGDISWSGGRGEVGKTSYGTTTTVKPYGSAKLSILYGQKGHTTGPSSKYPGWEDATRGWNIGVFGKYDTDEGPSFGVTGKYGILSGEIKKTIGSGVSGSVSLNLPIGKPGNRWDPK